MAIVYDDAELTKYMNEAVEVTDDRPILVDKFLDNATEVDVDCIADREISVIGSIMEHVEAAGVHSGDSACIIPTVTLSEKALSTIRKHTHALAKELDVCGLMNVQFAVQNDEVYIIEVNPRASRTIPFLSKAIGKSLAKYASLVQAGQTLTELGFTEEIIPEHYSVKEAVFPFVRFPGLDIILSPEMKSTGECMGIADTPGVAFLKAQDGAGNSIPKSGPIMVSLMSRDKEKVLPELKALNELVMRYTLPKERQHSFMKMA